jgi:hypothetical protein
MKQPTVRQTHALCYAVNAHAVIVIAMRGDEVKAASYGTTETYCQQAAYTLDCLIDAMTEGRIPVWATAESESKRLIALDAQRIRRGIEEGTHCAECKMPCADCDCDQRMYAEQYDEGADDAD